MTFEAMWRDLLPVGRSATSGGRSLIVDPWGAVLARGSEEGEEVVIADLDLGRQDEVRRQMPTLTHRRPEVYA